MVAACRMTGQSPQEAFNTVGDLLEQRYQEWENVITQLPSWGPKVDVDVARYIQGIQNVVQANITWRYEPLLSSSQQSLTYRSFQSGRYFGAQAAEIRRTRRIDVMINPPFLHARKVQSGWSAGVCGLLFERLSGSLVLSLVLIFYFATIISA